MTDCTSAISFIVVNNKGDDKNTKNKTSKIKMEY